MVQFSQTESFVLIGLEFNMREISFKAIKNMEGQKVLVRDIEYEGPSQICEIKILTDFIKGKIVMTGIQLEGEECSYYYDFMGRCKNGEFKVFTLK